MPIASAENDAVTRSNTQRGLGSRHNPDIDIMDQAALTQRTMQLGADGVDQSGSAVGDRQQRHGQSPPGQPGKEIGPRVSRFRGGGLHSNQHRLADACDPVRDHDRLSAGAVMHLEMRPVEKQVVHVDAGQVTVAERLEIGLESGTDP